MFSALAVETQGGLLCTTVTWDDVQKDCFTLWGQDAKLGPNKTIKDIADGKGSLSRIGVVENIWKYPELAEKEGWPKKFVIKMITLLQMKRFNKEIESGADKEFADEEDIREREKMYKRLHNVECNLYDKFKDCPQMSKLIVYVSHPFTEENQNKGYLIMEYVEDVIDMGVETYLEEELVDQILYALAWHHSTSPLFTEEEKERYSTGIVTDLFGVMLTPNFVSTSMACLSNFLGEEYVETYKKYKRGTEILMKQESIKKMDNMAEMMGMGRVLCHGDPWMCNVICTEKDGVRNLHSLIDYQASLFSCVGHDLARLLVNVLQYEERKNNAEHYIRKYWTLFTEIWKETGKKQPFTEEQLVASYRAYLPLASYVVGVSIAGLADFRSKQLHNPEKNRKMMKKKIIGLGKTLEESLIYLEALQ